MYKRNGKNKAGLSNSDIDGHKAAKLRKVNIKKRKYEEQKTKTLEMRISSLEKRIQELEKVLSGNGV